MTQTREPIGLAVLGSTGSVGTQTLDVVRAHPDRFKVVALAAGANCALLQEQIDEFRPSIVGAIDAADLFVDSSVQVIEGDGALEGCAAADGIGTVVVATSGIAAVPATLAAARLGRTIALANKEALVCAAGMLLPIIARTGARLHPVDSEHSAIWQCMGSLQRNDVHGITLTASGGPFREYNLDELEGVTAEDALNHPTWAMGRKITIDSATLVNKGLEAIEAHHIFGLPMEAITVVIHPESIVHSLVEFADGSTLAQLSHPDMRLPIQYALSAPEHLTRSFRSLDLATQGTLTFSEPNRTLFPALDLCYSAGSRGDMAGIALCGADEICVQAFLDGDLPFQQIAPVLKAVIDSVEDRSVVDMDDLFSQYFRAQDLADELVYGSNGPN
ncbi:MAG TPA: 1-deoxy-D-xylulose-5-phosphate reductoisomerase [Thermomicrobiales bacterium]|nr:1-deoxy-D-xylulose-5-phosphate reductoisomerase [Thermomicrobiales bacterium]